MAYEKANPIKLLQGRVGGTIAIWTYEDGDNKAAIDASGYFNLEAARLQVGDVIIATAGDGYGYYVVNANSRDLAASPPVTGVVDVANTVAIATIDSD